MRPWVLRALVITAVYGVGQAAFVAARAWAPDLTVLWTAVILAILLAVGVVWAGTEVVLGRRPEEWTWFRAALAAAPAAGVLSWALLALFVDSSGVADLGSALVGRAAFTALLVIGSATVGSRLGWLSLRRQGEDDDDPQLDRDETDPALARAGRRDYGVPSGGSGAPTLDPRTVARVARLREDSAARTERAERTERADGTGRTDRDPGEVPAPSTVGVPPGRLRRALSGGESESEPAARSGSQPGSEQESGSASATAGPSYEAPVVAVLPETTELPARPGPREPDEPADEDQDRPRRRGFGLRRPSRG